MTKAKRRRLATIHVLADLSRLSGPPRLIIIDTLAARLEELRELEDAPK